MRCSKDSFIEGSVFHIYNHSVSEIKLFNEPSDYEYFLQKFKEKANHSICEIYAYCLMPNHFHFCIHQNSDYPVFKIFNSVSTSYAMYYNNKYKRKGKVFAGKLQHKRIRDDKYLIAVCQYIHFNPVKASLVSDISDWKYSNYPEYVNRRNGTLFSQKLIEIYSDIFMDYENHIRNYEQYLEDNEFQELLFE
jgi:putative transposase